MTYAGAVSEQAEEQHVSQDDALARIESVDGIAAIEGVAIPSDVIGDKDRARWSHAQRWSRDTLNLPAADPQVQAMTRVIYDDRQTYPDNPQE